MGKGGVGVGVVGSCLRRNDGGGVGMTEDGARVPACAGMTAAQRWCRVRGVKRTANLLVAAQRACRALAALARSGGGA